MREESGCTPFCARLPSLVVIAATVAVAIMVDGTAAFSSPLTRQKHAVPTAAWKQHPAKKWSRQQQPLHMSVDSEQKNKKKIDDAKQEAEMALNNVGWSMPEPVLSGGSDGDSGESGEGSLTSDDPFVQAIDAGIQKDVGVTLEELLNPAKVVNLERDLFNLRMDLVEATGLDAEVVKQRAVEENDGSLSTELCDGGGGGDQADSLRKSISKKEADLAIERRSVFRGWLKNVFLVQAVLSFGLSYVMATSPSSLFGGNDWYYKYNMDLSISVLGYWWWWLFVIPSLRSRRPKGQEKKALDIAFIASPVLSLLAPVATTDTGIIWTANFVVVAACYAYALVLDNDEDDSGDSNKPEWVKFVFKSLDFGTGRERGARN